MAGTAPTSEREDLISANVGAKTPAVPAPYAPRGAWGRTMSMDAAPPAPPRSQFSAISQQCLNAASVAGPSGSLRAARGLPLGPRCRSRFERGASLASWHGGPTLSAVPLAVNLTRLFWVPWGPLRFRFGSTSRVGKPPGVCFFIGPRARAGALQAPREAEPPISADIGIGDRRYARTRRTQPTAKSVPSPTQHPVTNGGFLPNYAGPELPLENSSLE